MNVATVHEFRIPYSKEVLETSNVLFHIFYLLPGSEILTLLVPSSFSYESRRSECVIMPFAKINTNFGKILCMTAIALET
jgi:hypothetical protein